ncbi:MAG: hypothetical protein R3C05_09660 [Pirellulaceae bacterium]
MNPCQPFDAATEICILVDRKLAILNSLLQHGIQQQRLIQAGDADQLMSLLARKQSHLQELVDVQETLGVLLERHDEATLRWRSPQQRAECKQRIDHCNALGHEVLQLEGDCVQMAQRKRDAIAAQVQEFSSFRSSSSRTSSLNDQTHLAQFDESS